MPKLSGKDVLKSLKSSLSVNVEDYVALDSYERSKSAFALLIATVLSQNTSDKNAMKAFESLKKRIGLSPDRISKASLKELEEAVRPAGLYKRRAMVIKELSSMVSERGEEWLLKILEMPLEEARKELLKLPGIGRKTADVLLLFLAGKPTFPVDTHITRIAKRIGIVDEKASYEEIRSKLMEIFSPEDYLEAHLLLIALGRRYCKALKPLCESCPVRQHCKTGRR